MKPIQQNIDLASFIAILIQPCAPAAGRTHRICPELGAILMSKRTIFSSVKKHCGLFLGST